LRVTSKRVCWTAPASWTFERNPLTALANRVSFARDLDQAINSASHEKRSVHLLLIDLDRFNRHPPDDSLGEGEVAAF